MAHFSFDGLGGLIGSAGMYECLGLVYSVVHSFLSFGTLTVVSRKLISVSDHSAVNLMVGWTELRCSMNIFSSLRPCVQIMYTSSMYLCHMIGASG